MMLIRLPPEAGVNRLRCEGGIVAPDLDSPDPLEEQLGQDCYAGKVILSLQSASFIDSEGVGWLVVTHKKFQQAGGLLVLCSVPPVVDAVLQMMRLYTVLRMAQTEEAAQALALGAPEPAVDTPPPPPPAAVPLPADMPASDFPLLAWDDFGEGALPAVITAERVETGFPNSSWEGPRWADDALPSPSPVPGEGQGPGMALPPLLDVGMSLPPAAPQTPGALHPPANGGAETAPDALPSPTPSPIQGEAETTDSPASIQGE